jgi:SAM-dependent methyltransferase
MVQRELGTGAGTVRGNKEEIPCPVCGSCRYKVRYEPWVAECDGAALYGAAAGVRGTQRLVVCDGCSLLYENPRYPADVIVEGYAQSNDAGHDSQHAMRVRTFLMALRRLAPFLPTPGARVLDIGTAGGAFLEAAETFGYDAHGMEPSHYLVEKGRARGLKIEQGVIDDHTFPSTSFDMVALWDVLEHVCEPREALVKVAKLLKPNGIVLINFPDIDTWQAQLAGKYYWWILSVHLQHFSPATIRTVCKHAGLSAFRFQRHWQILEIGYLEHMAIKYGIPLARLGERLTPRFIQRLPFSYYASQTTALARLA